MTRTEELARYRLCLQLDPKKLLYSAILTREQLESPAPENSPYRLIPGLLQVELAMKYHRHGHYLKALNLLLEAARKGNGQAFYELSEWTSECQLFSRDRFIELESQLNEDDNSGKLDLPGRLLYTAAKLGYGPAIYGAMHLFGKDKYLEQKLRLMDHLSLGILCVDDEVSRQHRKAALKHNCLEALYSNASAAERHGDMSAAFKYYRKAAKRKHLKSLLALGRLECTNLMNKLLDPKSARHVFIEAGAQGSMKGLFSAINIIQISGMKSSWGSIARAMVSGLELSQVHLSKSRCYNLVTNRLTMVFAAKKDITYHLRELYWYGKYFSQPNHNHDDELDLECKHVYSQTLQARQRAFYTVMGVYKRRQDIPRDILRLIAKKMLSGIICPQQWGVGLIYIPEAIVESLKKDLANWHSRVNSYRKLDTLMGVCLNHKGQCDCHRQIAHQHVRMIVTAWKVSLGLIPP
jgi:TPR repeat protein